MLRMAVLLQLLVKMNVWEQPVKIQALFCLPVRWGDLFFMKSTDNWLLAFKHLIRKWIEPSKSLGPCLMSVWGILHAISGKPEIWQKSFRDASPKFYGQIAKLTLAWATWPELPGLSYLVKPSQLGFVWPKRNFQWRQAAPLMGFAFMNLAIASKNGIFCFGNSAKKMNDNSSDTWNFTQASWVRIKTFIIHSKQKGWDQKHR